MKLAQISKSHKVHAIYSKGKPSLTQCSMYIWDYIASEGNSENVTCNKCQEALYRESELKRNFNIK